MRGGNSNYIGLTSNLRLPPIQTRIVNGKFKINTSYKQFNPESSMTEIAVPKNTKRNRTPFGPTTARRVPRGGKRKTRRNRRQRRN